MHNCVDNIDQLLVTVQTQVNMKRPACMATGDKKNPDFA